MSELINGKRMVEEKSRGLVEFEVVDGKRSLRSVVEANERMRKELREYKKKLEEVSGKKYEMRLCEVEEKKEE